MIHDLETAPIRYARNGDSHVAYQTVGGGSVDLLLVPAMITHLEGNRAFDGYRRFVASLARFARVTVFDKSGQGMSDPSHGVGSFEKRLDDIAAVLDAIGSRRAAIVGNSEGAALAARFAAEAPERVTHLVLFGGFARFEAAADYPHVRTASEMRQRLSALRDSWGSEAVAMRAFLPSAMSDPRSVAAFSRLERLCYSPGALVTAYTQNAEIDIRGSLPRIERPCLVAHRVSDLSIGVENARYLAANIPRARLIEYDGPGDHLVWGGDVARICADIERFVTGSENASPAQRALVTVLMTDIIGSKRIASELGDAAWRTTLDSHDETTVRLVEAHGGERIKTTGDGALAVFPTPSAALRCGLALRRAMGALGLGLRAAAHTGEIERRGGDVSGLAVHVAARLLDDAGDGFLAPRLTSDLARGAGVEVTEGGRRAIRGADMGLETVFVVA